MLDRTGQQRETQGRLSDERLWSAITNRDASLDGKLYFGVATTGVYCRPSCPARRPNRANVTLFPTPDAAEAAGFRPCKRCTPRGLSTRERDAALITAACRSIESAETVPSLAALAHAAHMSPHHFHRLFKAVTGVTPKAYSVAHRRTRVQSALSRAPTVTDALYEAGFNSSARFYAGANKMLGMTPSAARAGGAHTALRYATSPCSLGTVLVAASDLGIAAILLGDDAPSLLESLKDRFPKAELSAGDRGFAATVAAVVRLIEEPGGALNLPLDVRGTVFQARVWAALQAIPAGETRSYSDIAHAIDQPTAVRAVASACAANPAAVVIPCHRVLARDGKLTGYRWGVERKRALLAREKKS